MACDGSVWHPPITDYHPSNPQGVTGDDLNEIGCDLLYLYNRTGETTNILVATSETVPGQELECSITVSGKRYSLLVDHTTEVDHAVFKKLTGDTNITVVLLGFPTEQLPDFVNETIPLVGSVLVGPDSALESDIVVRKATLTFSAQTVFVNFYFGPTLLLGLGRLHLLNFDWFLPTQIPEPEPEP